MPCASCAALLCLLDGYSALTVMRALCLCVAAVTAAHPGLVSALLKFLLDMDVIKPPSFQSWLAAARLDAAVKAEVSSLV